MIFISFIGQRHGKYHEKKNPKNWKYWNPYIPSAVWELIIWSLTGPKTRTSCKKYNVAKDNLPSFSMDKFSWKFLNLKIDEMTGKSRSASHPWLHPTLYKGMLGHRWIIDQISNGFCEGRRCREWGHRSWAMAFRGWKEGDNKEWTNPWFLWRPYK